MLKKQEGFTTQLTLLFGEFLIFLDNYFMIDVEHKKKGGLL
jgi:hypothetical protein